MIVLKIVKMTHSVNTSHMTLQHMTETNKSKIRSSAK